MQRKADFSFELWYKLFFGVDKTSCKLALYLQSSTTSWLKAPSPVCHVNFYRWLCLVLSCLSSVEPAGELVFIVLTPGYLSRLLKEALLIVLLDLVAQVFNYLLPHLFYLLPSVLLAYMPTSYIRLTSS